MPQQIRQAWDQAHRNGEEIQLDYRRVVLHSTDEYPLILIDETIQAAKFAQTALSSDCQFVVFVDGSARRRSTSSPSPPSFPSSPLSPGDSSPSSSSASLDSFSTRSPSPESPTPRRMDGGAAVSYNEKGTGWEAKGFRLPGVASSSEAEMRAIEQGFEEALKRAKNPAFRKKIILLTDSQQAMTALAKHLKGTTKWSEADEAASYKARQLRQLVEIEVHGLKPSGDQAWRCWTDCCRLSRGDCEPIYGSSLKSASI
ncbi:uncharacterized protein BDV14DRAFT_205220 [Aspergillus stella-maris]|uniref:uncharacterized protein n=1 Tax=Aspergillus stella-maris TaxID=1810926 RepID=UPI003CCDC994